MLLASNSPYHIAVIKEAGYCLCELAKNPRRTASVPKDDGALEMGKNVQRVRFAAGLTQTALAERAGMNRTHLCRLEGGRRCPHYPR
jgi:DNA-binding XRE family transcriptional regulator